ncbi:hypothetical protein VP01_1g1 [Puccinia sorghi]|uniref:Uncharacterized protein n=1 Tax=Puccinia sorghi TaxID=27349 RepID=A0A0L6VBI1_9BASI|nr:hypothetical protein VP01_1g1 [Puccinia sorghi]
MRFGFSKGISNSRPARFIFCGIEKRGGMKASEPSGRRRVPSGCLLVNGKLWLTASLLGPSRGPRVTIDSWPRPSCLMQQILDSYKITFKYWQGLQPISIAITVFYKNFWCASSAKLAGHHEDFERNTCRVKFSNIQLNSIIPLILHIHNHGPFVLFRGSDCFVLGLRPGSLLELSSSHLTCIPFNFSIKLEAIFSTKSILYIPLPVLSSFPLTFDEFGWSKLKGLKDKVAQLEVNTQSRQWLIASQIQNKLCLAPCPSAIIKTPLCVSRHDKLDSVVEDCSARCGGYITIKINKYTPDKPPRGMKTFKELLVQKGTFFFSN